MGHLLHNKACTIQANKETPDVHRGFLYGCSSVNQTLIDQPTIDGFSFG